MQTKSSGLASRNKQRREKAIYRSPAEATGMSVHIHTASTCMHMTLCTHTEDSHTQTPPCTHNLHTCICAHPHIHAHSPYAYTHMKPSHVHMWLTLMCAHIVCEHSTHTGLHPCLPNTKKLFTLCICPLTQPQATHAHKYVPPQHTCMHNTCTHRNEPLKDEYLITHMAPTHVPTHGPCTHTHPLTCTCPSTPPALMSPLY